MASSVPAWLTQLLLAALPLLLLFSLLRVFSKIQAERSRRRRRRRREAAAAHDSLFPRGPPAWPILGHLPLFQSGCPHRTLAALSTTHGYGPIIGLRLGSQPAIVISSAALARDVLLIHDKHFASRPRYLFTDSLHYGYETGVLFSAYGPSWAALRKILTLELFTAKRLHDHRSVRQEEITRLVHSLLQASSDGTQIVEVGKYVADMASDIISRLLRSKRMSAARPRSEAGSCAELTDQLPYLIKEVENATKPTLGDFIPWLKWSDVWQRRRMEQLRNRLDKVIDAMVMERRKVIRSCTAPSDLPHDFLQALLSKESGSFCNDQDQPDRLCASQIKNGILDFLVAGIHTTSITIEWAMAELLRNPRCLHKLHEEIDAVMNCTREHDVQPEELATASGGINYRQVQRLVRDEDLPKLPYLEQVVKEVLRLHPAGPLLLPRISTKECKVGKYLLPEGTHTFVNVWAMGRDPEVWEKAEEFWPERFEGRKVDVRGQDYELLPFGSGRRMCPAWRMGMAVVQVAVANMVLAFEWELPPGQTPQSVDMAEKRGISSSRASPLRAIPKLRSLDMALY